MEALKNNISPELVECIAMHAEKHVASFKTDTFRRDILKTLPSLELKQRIELVADALYHHLPSETAMRHAVLIKMLHPDALGHSNKDSDSSGLCGWAAWPIAMVVGKYGLDDFDSSMEALKEITKRGTSEFDVRPFIISTPERAFETITAWSKDENYHVRRLASEGTRPRLPWGIQLKQLIEDPSPAISILLNLRDDPEEYVRRSVANHLNDIAKDHPDFVAELAHQWLGKASKQRQKLVRHACRSLIKQGHKRTLQAFGIDKPNIDAPQLNIASQNVCIGEDLNFSVVLTSNSAKRQKILIDYVIHYQKANGMTSPKVFKWKELTLGPKERLVMERRHSIKQVTTRKLYTGEHGASLIINGHNYGDESFFVS